MNTVKEKKLNAIKSDISDIKDFVISNSSINEKQLSNDGNLNDSEDDTITLTNIVDTKNSVSNVNILADIKQDLNLLKSIRPPGTVEQEREINKTSPHHIIGMCIETRPDAIDDKWLKLFLQGLKVKRNRR